jgi:hypothetical protein
MTEILPDVWSLHSPQVNNEPQYVEQLARAFQKQQYSDDPHRDAEQQDGDTPE